MPTRSGEVHVGNKSSHLAGVVDHGVHELSIVQNHAFTPLKSFRRTLEVLRCCLTLYRCSCYKPAPTLVPSLMGILSPRNVRFGIRGPHFRASTRNLYYLEVIEIEYRVFSFYHGTCVGAGSLKTTPNGKHQGSIKQT
jgi:hypothetical protein